MAERGEEKETQAMWWESGIWELGEMVQGGFQTGLSDVNSCHPLSSVYLERQQQKLTKALLTSMSGALGGN